MKKFVIHFNTHVVSVSVDDDNVYRLFKYNDIRCEIETFTTQLEAEEYILKPFPDLEFLVTVHDEEE